MAFENYSASTNFVGKDGFHWWIGQVEKTDAKTKNSNRYKVRIVGHHLAPCEAQDTEDLPWAQCIAPTTSAFNSGSPITTNLEPGSWVLGFFMDAEMSQQPFILGSIGAVNNSLTSDQLPLQSFSQGDPEGCRAFTNFATQVNSAYLAISRDKRSLTAAKDGVLSSAGAAPGSNPTPEAGGPGGASTATYILGQGGAMNPSGTVCVPISQAECPTGKTASKLEIILSELFKIVSQSGGAVGDYMTSKITGYASAGQSFVMGYIDKCLAVIMQGFGWIKGELYYYVQLGVQKLIGVLLSLISDKGKPKDSKPPYDPKKPEKLLDQIQKFLEDELAKIGCSIESLYDTLLEYLTDLLFGLVNQIWSKAFCAIDALVQNAVNAIQSFLTSLINEIMGPLQDILEGIAEPLNIIGGAIQSVFDFFGIQCSGLPEECKELIIDCGSGPQQGADGDDFLDRLLSDIAGNGKPFPPSGVCDEAREDSPTPPNVVVTNGIPVVSTPDGPTPDVVDPSEPTEPEIPLLTILLDPVSEVKDPGESASFTTIASASDGSVVSYQWQRDTGTGFIDIAGATSSTYSIGSVSASDNNNTYRCVVSGINTLPLTATSDVAYLLVSQTSVPPSIPNSFDGQSFGTIKFSSAANISFLDSLIPVNEFGYDNSNLGNSIPTVTFSGDAIATYTQSPDVVVVTPPSYSLSVTPLVAKAGDLITITLTTENVSNGTQLGYLLFANKLRPEDFVDGKLTGVFTVTNNSAVVQKTLVDTVSFTEDQVAFAALNNGQAATSFVIKGTGVYKKPEEPFVPETPIACPPIVSNSGKIISIPICKQGTQYIAPPSIFIQSDGYGYGASAVPVLDTSGFLKEIRVVRPGRGYPPNPPTDNLDCVVTGFTIIKNGFGYDEPPIVYVDGDPNVGEAVIDKGIVVGITVKDKTKTFTDNPSVRIVTSSSGIGAIAVANIQCLDRTDVQAIAEIVSPTPVGEYIDCP